MTTSSERAIEPMLQKRLWLGSILTMVLVVGLGGWGSLASLSSAVIAPGIVVVEGHDKKVQHPTGGVVGEIFVRSGTAVEAGQLLIRLDAAQTEAALGVVVSQIVQLEARSRRLEAERDGASEIVFPESFLSISGEARTIAESEKRLFHARITARKGQEGQLRERIGQLQKEIEGLKAQLDSKTDEIRLMNEELSRVSQMKLKSLVPQTRVLTAERDLTRLNGERGLLVSNIARAEGQISEIEMQILSLEQTVQSDSMKELREVEARLAELAERRHAAQDQLNRIDITAPRSGVVHDLQVHTVGGVIQAAETIMSIVPQNEVLAIEVRVAPADIDQIKLGQQATLRFSAFNHRQTEEFLGEVIHIAANLSTEPQTGISYYSARLKISDKDADKARSLKIVPGMPVETFIETGQRKAGSYFLKPLTDQMARAFREE